jgi:hypothetical protein
MNHLSGLPIVRNVARQALREAQTAVESGKERQPAVGALTGLIERSVGGTAEEVFEENGLSGRIQHLGVPFRRLIGLGTNKIATIAATPFSIQGVTS